MEAVRREVKLEQSDDDGVSICPPLSIYTAAKSEERVHAAVPAGRAAPQPGPAVPRASGRNDTRGHVAGLVDAGGHAPSSPPQPSP
jgi:hypothetical protein